MTDETRPTDGRTPSDVPESDTPGRPDFRPAGSWGSPSAGPAAETAAFAGPDSERHAFGRSPDAFAPPSDVLAEPTGAFAPRQPAPFAAQPTGVFAAQPGDPFSGETFPQRDGGAHAQPRDAYGQPRGGYGPPAGDAAPPFGGQGAPPPPPYSSGLGPGWGPPPSGAVETAVRPGPSLGVLVVIAVVIAALAAGLGSVGTYLLTRESSGTNPGYSLGPVPTGSTVRPPDSVAGVSARVLPSVVSLDVGNGADAASGSGFLIKGGYVVTNNHVVAMAARGGEIRVNFNNRNSTTARIVGRDAGSDLAVVKPEETFGTPEIVLGNSDQVVVGDPVIAVGSPLGLTGTVTTGIVSSLNRPVVAGQENAQRQEDVAYISAIQTDAAINPGNSGGPLVNVKGEVVGVNSAIATLGRSAGGESGNIGLGFAIPSNQARRVAEDLIKYGKAKRPRIGIVLDNDYRGQGVKIAASPQGGQQPVDAAGPAGKAGLRAGDVILEIDGLRLENGNELIALIRAKAPGSKVTVKYQRDGKEMTASLVVMAEEEPGSSPTPS